MNAPMDAAVVVPGFENKGVESNYLTHVPEGYRNALCALIVPNLLREMGIPVLGTLGTIVGAQQFRRGTTSGVEMCNAAERSFTVAIRFGREQGPVVTVRLIPDAKLRLNCQSHDFGSKLMKACLELQRNQPAMFMNLMTTPLSAASSPSSTPAAASAPLPAPPAPAAAPPASAPASVQAAPAARPVAPAPSVRLEARLPCPIDSKQWKEGAEPTVPMLVLALMVGRFPEGATARELQAAFNAYAKVEKAINWAATKLVEEGACVFVAIPEAERTDKRVRQRIELTDKGKELAAGLVVENGQGVNDVAPPWTQSRTGDAGVDSLKDITRLKRELAELEEEIGVDTTSLRQKQTRRDQLRTEINTQVEALTEALKV